MSAPPPPVGALEPEGWSHSVGGEITERRPQSKGDYARFKHSRSLQAKDVWRMRVEVGRRAWVGSANEKYNAEKHGETYKSTAHVSLSVPKSPARHICTAQKSISPSMTFISEVLFPLV